MLSGGQSVRPARHIRRAHTDVGRLRSRGLVNGVPSTTQNKENQKPAPLYFAWTSNADKPETDWSPPVSYFHWTEDADISAMHAGARQVDARVGLSKRARGRKSSPVTPRRPTWWGVQPEDPVVATAPPLADEAEKASEMAAEESVEIAAPLPPVEEEEEEMMEKEEDELLAEEDGEEAVPIETEAVEEDELDEELEFGNDQLEIVGRKIQIPKVVMTPEQEAEMAMAMEAEAEAEEVPAEVDEPKDAGEDEEDSIARIMAPVDRALNRVRSRRRRAIAKRLETLQRLSEAPTPADKIRERRRRLQRPWKVLTSSTPKPKPFFPASSTSPITRAKRFVDPPTPRDRSRRATTYSRSYDWR